MDRLVMVIAICSFAIALMLFAIIMALNEIKDVIRDFFKWDHDEWER